jgi:cell division inhibitor SepF
MPGQMRKIMAYLGLVDDEYDDYDDLSERSRPAPRPARSSRPEPRDQYDDDRYDRGGRSEPRDRYDRDQRDQRDQRDFREQPYGTVSRIRPVTQDGSPAGSRGPAPVPPRPVVSPMSPQARPFVVAPTRFSDAKEVGDHIRQSNPVIVNLQSADRDLQRRMIDFCSGIAYALGCEMERVADQVFLLTPTNVTVSAEERARLQARGFNDD